ncbi:hypothetical protein IWQ61_007045 [Dispira simplex]|nr:hypothetical protein IWQ61_007045 [Dispira simplex]
MAVGKSLRPKKSPLPHFTWKIPKSVDRLSLPLTDKPPTELRPVTTPPAARSSSSSSETTQQAALEETVGDPTAAFQQQLNEQEAHPQSRMTLTDTNEEEKKALTKRAETAEEKLEECKKELVISAKKLEDYEKKLGLSEEKLEEYEKELEDYEKKLVISEDENAVLNTRVKELEATVAHRDAELAQLVSRKLELHEEIMAKCSVIKPTGRRTYRSLLLWLTNMKTETDHDQLLDGLQWPMNDATTMVVSGLSKDVNQSTTDLVRGGLPEAAILNIEPLSPPYSLLTTPTSMHTDVLDVLTKLCVDIVDLEEAMPENQIGLSESGRDRLAKCIAQRLDERMVSCITEERYIIGHQIRQMAEKLKLPISPLEEVEKKSLENVERSLRRHRYR